ncbi:hypothetical protein EV199_3403 [Pseudobacter ginsenosidimutans]|uniref:Uncharacterized protein n=1 Tax=Pseudobacter ginsenosidimutans TaxID=661488 RepID=A0A4Q7MU80_9BACT|nr:hypothetical protein EV199_3403 [Pseudobacter ginsenosidimutans]
MPDKFEKNSRKQILSNLSKKAAEEFENSLPMSRDNFMQLFDHLDVQLLFQNLLHICDPFKPRNFIANKIIRLQTTII